MEVIDYRRDHLIELTALYNDLTRSVPHCFPIEAEELAAAFDGECGIESRGKHLTTETVYVAIDGEMVGFVHVGEGNDEEDNPTAYGVIRFLAYPRGRRDVGQALLERAEQWLRQSHLASVVVSPQTFRYPFYAFAHAYLSNHLDHVQAVLLSNGYHCNAGEIFLDWPDFKPNPSREVTDITFDLKVERNPGLGRLPDISVKAYQEGQHIGECMLLSGGTFSRREAAEEWVFCQWLGVSDPFQGKGLGRYLLGRALVEARDAGYRHAGISCDRGNHRALLFYSNYGFHAVDWTLQFGKEMGK